MRDIYITVDKNGKVSTDTHQLGYSGEHNATVMNFSFAKDSAELIEAVNYYRVVIDGHYSNDLYESDGTLTYSVPQECMCPPRVQCQLVGYRAQNGEPTVIIKTEVFSFNVDRSEVPFIKISNKTDVFEQAMENCRNSVKIAERTAANAINAADTASGAANVALVYSGKAEAAAKIAQNGAETVAKVVFEVDNITNALKGSASGKAVALTDVSPLEHNIKVQLSGDLPGSEEEVLTKTEAISTKGATVMLNTPAESVRVVMTCDAYCVGGIIPLVDGEDLTASKGLDSLAIIPVFSYSGEGGVCDIVYTIEGETLSWVGTRTIVDEDYSAGHKEISGSFKLSTSGQKITGFCQVYDLDETNPYYMDPEFDNLYITVALYEGYASSVKVKVYGKNLFDFSKIESLNNGIYGASSSDLPGYNLKIDSDGDDIIVSSKTGKYYTVGFVGLDFVVGQTYTVSFAEEPPHEGTWGWYGTYKDGSRIGSTGGNQRTYFTFTPTAEVKSVGFRFGFGADVLGESIRLVKPMLELGATATDYEPFVEPIEYTAKADGTVECVKSVYPSMTLITNIDGVNIDAEYNRDINKAFQELQAAIISIGGNV